MQAITYAWKDYVVQFLSLKVIFLAVREHEFIQYSYNIFQMLLYLRAS